MLGKNPYQSNTRDDRDVYTSNDVLKDAVGNITNLNTYLDTFFDIGKRTGTLYNTTQLLSDIASGEYNDDIITGTGNRLAELIGIRSSGYVLMNNHPFHVEQGSFKIKPKLNISEMDMYTDGGDGKSYTYMQWLNTTGREISMTILNGASEKYVGNTIGEAAEGETAEDTTLYDSSTKVNEVLLWWAEHYHTIEFYTMLPIPNIKGQYKITEIEQTVEYVDMVKTDLTLHSYDQDEVVEETYYKQYDLSELGVSDTSKDSSLATKIGNIGVQSKSCLCTVDTSSDATTTNSISTTGSTTY